MMDIRLLRRTTVETVVLLTNSNLWERIIKYPF